MKQKLNKLKKKKLIRIIKSNSYDISFNEFFYYTLRRVYGCKILSNSEEFPQHYLKDKEKRMLKKFETKKVINLK